MPTFPTSATREFTVETIATWIETPASQWQKFAGGRNPNLLRTIGSLATSMETNLSRTLAITWTSANEIAEIWSYRSDWIFKIHKPCSENQYSLILTQTMWIRKIVYSMWNIAVFHLAEADLLHAKHIMRCWPAFHCTISSMSMKENFGNNLHISLKVTNAAITYDLHAVAMCAVSIQTYTDQEIKG